MSISSTKHFVTGRTVLEVHQGVAGIYSWRYLLWIGWEKRTREALLRRPDGVEHHMQAGELAHHWSEVIDETRATELRKLYGWR